MCCRWGSTLSLWWRRWRACIWMSWSRPLTCWWLTWRVYPCLKEAPTPPSHGSRNSNATTGGCSVWHSPSLYLIHHLPSSPSHKLGCYQWVCLCKPPPPFFNLHQKLKCYSRIYESIWKVRSPTQSINIIKSSIHYNSQSNSIYRILDFFFWM